MKQIVVELRLRLEADEDTDKDEAAQEFFRSCRGQPAEYLLERLKVVEVEVENQYGFIPNFEGWRYRDFTDGE